MSFESIEDAYVVEEVVPFHMDDGDEVWDDPIVSVNQADNSLEELFAEDDEKAFKEANEAFNDALEGVLIIERENILGKDAVENDNAMEL